MEVTRNNRDKSIEGLKREIKVCVDTFKYNDSWLQFEGLYKDLNSIEELASVRKTTLEELLGLDAPHTAPDAPIDTGKQSQLILGDPQEPEVIAEVEKGS